MRNNPSRRFLGHDVLSLVVILVLLATGMTLGSQPAGADPSPATQDTEQLRAHVDQIPPRDLRPTWRRDLVGRLERVIGALAADDPCAGSDEILAAIDAVDDWRDAVRRSIDASAKSPSRVEPQERRLSVLDDLRERLLVLRVTVMAEREPGVGCEGGATVAVDTAVTPTFPSVPGPSGEDRRLAAMVNARGVQTDFVADELWIASTDPAAGAAFAGRWNATIVATEVGDEGTIHTLIRVPRPVVDAESLPALLAEIKPGQSDAVAVSSAAARDLLAAAANEAASGLQVAVNVVGLPQGIADGRTRDAPFGPAGWSVVSPWSSNAFDWRHLRARTRPQIGVPQAWQLLHNAGVLASSSVGLGVLDQGFDTDDMPPDLIYRSTIAGFGLGSESPIAGWHGLHSIQTAAGVVDNGVGAAGTGGPVARPIAVYSSYDYFLAMAGIRTAIDNGARIVSMSFSADVPSIFDWTVLPFRAYTGELRDTLLVASAGNGGPFGKEDPPEDEGDVDSTECVVDCWESTFHTPCENPGVVCVGGLGFLSSNRDPQSSYGTEHSGSVLGNESVDIYAPFWGLVAGRGSPDTAQVYNGTSHAAPYVAGIAALMWNANPGLDWTRIASILALSARTDSPDVAVHRIIDAVAAVQVAMPPLANITSPADGEAVPRGVDATFRVFSNGPPASDAVWTSDRDGEFGRGSSVTTNSLSFGRHVITARAGGVSDTISVEILNEPPAVRIDYPLQGATFSRTQALLPRGTSIDRNEVENGGTLTDDQVWWTIDDDLTPVATGHRPSIEVAHLPAGEHRLRFHGSDGEFEVARSVRINLVDGIGSFPNVEIIMPEYGQRFIADKLDADRRRYAEVRIKGSIRDVEDGTPCGCNPVWTDSMDDAPPIEIAYTSDTLVRLYAKEEAFSNSRHVLTLTATDSHGNSQSHSVTVFVDTFD